MFCWDGNGLLRGIKSALVFCAGYADEPAGKMRVILGGRGGRRPGGKGEFYGFGSCGIGWLKGAAGHQRAIAQNHSIQGEA